MLNKEQKIGLVERMIEKSKGEMYLAELDSEFFKQHSLVNKEAQAGHAIKEAQRRHLEKYLEFLAGKLEELKNEQ